MQSLPTLFVPHGSPLFALNPGAAGAALTATAKRLPRPRAIVVVSGHWSARTPSVGNAPTNERNRTIHDFYGFPDPLYRIEYPAGGDPAICADVLIALKAAGFTAQSVDYGLDHGAWIPLRLMYPKADIPVIPLSLIHDCGPAEHWKLGRALAGLTTQGILIVASGNMTHNLYDLSITQRTGASPEEVPAYVLEFADWMATRLAAGDTEALLAYRSESLTGERAHPSEEHLLPLFVALGAAGNNWRAERLYAGVDYHVLAMDSYALWPTQAKAH